MIEIDSNKIDDRSFYFSKIMPIKNKILTIINEEVFFDLIYQRKNSSLIIISILFLMGIILLKKN